MSQMQVILRTKIIGLGSVGDVVSVKRGYARNYLLPNKMAVRNDKANLAAVMAEREHIQAELDRVLASAKTRAEGFSGATLHLARNAKEDGVSLFGAISATDVVGCLAEQDLEAKRTEVLFSAGEIKTVGEHVISIRFHPEVVLELPLSVAALTEEE